MPVPEYQKLPPYAAVTILVRQVIRIPECVMRELFSCVFVNDIGAVA